MHSFLGVPIVGRRGVFGNLYLTEKVGGALFTEEDEYIAVLLANSVAAVVENARHHEESARLLEEVQQLHRARERFFAMVNHELRNALAAVYGWSEMLVRKKDPSTVPQAAFEVLDSAQQAIGLINDLLDLSRLDEDRLKPVIRPIEPGSVAKRAIGRVTPAAQARRVTLVLEVARSLPTCETDASRVEQILVNLLGNAIQHTPEGTSVRLEVSVARWARRVHGARRGAGGARDRAGAHLRHLRDQEGRRHARRGAGSPALAAPRPAAGRGPARGGDRGGRGGVQAVASRHVANREDIFIPASAANSESGSRDWCP